MKDVLDRILAIKKTGSNELRNNLLIDLKDEAYKIARIHCNKLGRNPTSEEFLIALHAMNEAIDRFDQNKNTTFRTFADKMIFHRLINFFRKEKKQKEKQTELVAHDVDITFISDRANTDKEYSENLLDELTQFKKIIRYLGYKWSDIIRNRPTHRDSRDKLQTIAIYIVHVGLGERFLKENPISRQLKKLIGSAVDSRTLKKYRPYLCALIIAYIYNFPIIKNHLEYLRKEGHNGTSQRSSR